MFNFRIYIFNTKFRIKVMEVMVRSCPKFHVKKRTLLAIGGCVWIIAGANIARLGIQAYKTMGKVPMLDIILSLVVFGAFAGMFFRLSGKHSNRIHAYEEDTRSFWHFFDLKSYIIMAVMMSGGMWLRMSGIVSDEFIAFFYTGLGIALAFAGVSFWWNYFKFPKNAEEEDE